MIRTVVGIDGMMCGMCEAHINDVIRSHFRVKKVSSSHGKGEAVILSEEEINEEILRTAIKETGYTVTSVTSAPYEKKGFFAALFGK